MDSDKVEIREGLKFKINRSNQFYVLGKSKRERLIEQDSNILFEVKDADGELLTNTMNSKNIEHSFLIGAWKILE